MENDENTPPQPRRSVVIRHDEDDEAPYPPDSNRTGLSGWRPTKLSPYKPTAQPLDSPDTSEKRVAPTSAEQHRVLIAEKNAALAVEPRDSSSIQ